MSEFLSTSEPQSAVKSKQNTPKHYDDDDGSSCLVEQTVAVPVSYKNLILK